MTSQQTALGRLAVTLAALPLVLSACGGGSADEAAAPEPDAAPGGLPTGPSGDPLCSALWEPGTVMPEGVVGCTISATDNTVAVVLADSCPDGRTLVSSSDYGWAFVGEEVHVLAAGARNADDPEFIEAQEACPAS